MSSANPLFSFENPDDSPGFLLWQATNLWQRELKKALARFDLTHAQFVVLAAAYWLSQQREPVTQVALAAHAHIDKMMASKILRLLEGRGLVTRVSQQHDTRANAVTLTATGTRTVVQAAWAVEEFEAGFFGSVPTLQGQLQILLAAQGG
ncbi:MarR family winged helix-turn-helix transcriptional regulator [Hymenobacter sp. BT175]|uniref:MarR family winged helix-turn-helix transcriptional regulator n=1 Tax=Hymenobacter translucens TaxID=2886507 RepID=UPI001D0F2E3F|nr:MarR family winged helix-turn-helix transcriptional regulator [Hymenobacter translucens]MCC2547188.1 MarR family winged helix-turn-helix transcriptional regulator [Hymenobacter translucens]